MATVRNDMIARLEREILCLQGMKHTPGHQSIDTGLGFIGHAFPGQAFPLGAIHEFIAEDAAATSGFVAGIVSALMVNNGVAVWISRTRTLFPAGLDAFGIPPDKIIFIDLQKERDLLWAMEETLKCSRLSAVIGELHDLSFTASRRLQLAVEQSRVTGFILCSNAGNTTAAVTRWKITSLPGVLYDGLPGVGFPRWNIHLIKVRNGKPGSWQVEWVNGKFRPVFDVAFPVPGQQKKTG